MTLTDETPLAGEIPAVMNGLTPDQPFQDFANRIAATLANVHGGHASKCFGLPGLDIPRQHHRHPQCSVSGIIRRQRGSNALMDAADLRD